MDRLIQEAQDHSRIVVSSDGNLTVRGGDSGEVEARGSRGQIKLEQRGEEIWVISRSDCTLHVPSSANLKLEQCNGNATIKSIDGAVEAEAVKGNLRLRDTGPVRIGVVHGDLSAKRVEGSLSAGSVYGNASIRDVAGEFQVEDQVHGNLRLDGVEGGAQANCQGNINLRIDPQAGQSYSFESDGNILVLLPDAASVAIEVTQAERVTLSIKSTGLFDVGNAPYSRTLGEGGAKLTLAADGNVMITSQGADFDLPEDFGSHIGADMSDLASSISGQVAEQIEAQMELLEKQIEAQVENLTASFDTAGLTSEESSRIAEKAHKAAERATARAHEKMSQAQERMRRKLEAIQRRNEQRARGAERRHAGHEQHGFGFTWPAPPPPPPDMDEPVSEDERLMILKMLEEKKITLEQAEKLLAALEGKGSD